MQKFIGLMIVFLAGYLAGILTYTPARPEALDAEALSARKLLVTTLGEAALDQRDPYGPQDGSTVARGSFSEAGIEAGIEALLPAFAWVTVQVDDARNGNSTHALGDSCSVARGGRAISTMLGYGDSLLVAYQNPIPGSQYLSRDDWNQTGQGYGAQCGNGTLFLMPRAVFNRLRDSTVSW